MGKVYTVLLLSDEPIHLIEKIYLDYQSRTSVNLLKILLKDHWTISPELINSAEGYEDMIGGKNAGLMIRIIYPSIMTGRLTVKRKKGFPSIF